MQRVLNLPRELLFHRDAVLVHRFEIAGGEGSLRGGELDRLRRSVTERLADRGGELGNAEQELRLSLVALTSAFAMLLPVTASSGFHGQACKPFAAAAERTGHDRS